MAITLITSNPNKESEFKLLLGNQIDVMKAEYPELRSDADNPCEVSMIAAKTLANRLKKTVIVEDSGLFIHALNGFPGTSTKYVTTRIGNKGILKLMKGVKDRRCTYKSAIGYCEPGKEAICFTASDEGIISIKEKGKNGWGNDFIFIPKGNKKTYAELKKPGEPGTFRVESVNKLKEYIELR